MIVYIESNFILQLALQQEESEEAEAILKLAQSGDIELAFPAFAISEPFSTITYHDIERRRVYDLLSREATQLHRSALHQQIVPTLKSLLATWVDLGQNETSSLQSTVQLLLDVGKLIEITSSTFNQALAYQIAYGLLPKDSIIYAGIMADLQRAPREELKCFVSSDSDFGIHPAIKSELQTYNCRYISKFSQALQFVKSIVLRDSQA
jgi:predicted nucleic acid-binding protein